MVYGMNDYADVDIDKQNPRKGGLHGAQASESDLLLCVILGVGSCIALAPMVTGDLLWSLVWNVFAIGSNWFYNFGPRLSRVPFLDMIPPLGYLLITPLASKVMDI